MKNGTGPLSATEYPDLDAIDHEIIGELMTDGRISLVKLGRRVSLSPPAIADRSNASNKPA